MTRRPPPASSGARCVRGPGQGRSRPCSTQRHRRDAARRRQGVAPGCRGREHRQPPASRCLATMEPRAGRELPLGQAIPGRRPEPWSCAAAPGRGCPLSGRPEPKSPEVAACVRARARLPFDALSPLAEPQGRRGSPGARGALHMWGHGARETGFASSSLMHRARARGRTPWGARQRLPRAQPAGSRQGPQVECQWWHGMPPPQPCRQAAPARQTGLMHPGMLSVDAVRELVLC
jgi:hypothetical protein